MEEKVLIESKNSEKWKKGVLFCALFAAINIVLLIINFSKSFGPTPGPGVAVAAPDATSAVVSYFPGIIIGILGCVIIVTIAKVINNCSIMVTDKRVIGKINKKNVDLPIDSISAVGTGGGSSITVSTASGVIRFKWIENNEEIRRILSKLIMQRQEDAKKQIVSSPVAESTSNADELKKYKELLDSGVITQEEFDAKKKQLLGL